MFPTSSPRRGVGRRHCTLGWDAVDAGSVLDEAQSAYGEVVWSWRRDAGVKLVSKSSRVTVANSPFTGESTK